jgi:hypothetical protein
VEEVIQRMLEVLRYVVVGGGVVLIFGRFYTTIAGLVVGIFFMILVNTHGIEDLVPRSFLLAEDVVLICGGLYAGTKEAGIARIWSYFAATVGVCLAITTIFGIGLGASS